MSNNNDKVCLPGFNNCEQPKTKEVKMTNTDVCLPGFNTCGVPETPTVKPVAGKEGKCLPGFNSCFPAESKDASAEDEFDKEVLNTDKKVLLYFSAPWCQHCKALSPIIDEIATENADTVTVVKIDIDAQPKTAEKFQVAGVPMLIVVQDKKIVDTAVGGRSKEEVKALLGLAKADKAAGEEKVCLPGFNDCEQPKTKEVKMTNTDVCLPGFNTCGVPETPKPQSSASKDGKCLPGFNSCD